MTDPCIPGPITDFFFFIHQKKCCPSLAQSVKSGQEGAKFEIMEETG